MSGSWADFMNFSSKWNSQAAASWEKIRARGKARYVILRWIFFWGLGTAAVFNLIETFLRLHGTPSVSLAHWGFLWFPILGIYVGISHWNLMDAGYRNYLSHQELKALDELSAKP
jgi:hypothetical protein